MAEDKLLPERVQWATNAAVAQYVLVSGAASHKELVHHDGGQGRHQWLSPNLAAFVASQARSPKSRDICKVSKSVYPCRSVKLGPLSEQCIVEALSDYRT